MKSKEERRQVFALVCHYFDEVASLPHVKDKWITMEIWYHLLLQNTSMDKELIDFSIFKRTIKTSGQFSTFMNKSSKFGQYFNQWCKRVEGII